MINDQQIINIPDASQFTQPFEDTTKLIYEQQLKKIEQAFEKTHAGKCDVQVELDEPLYKEILNQLIEKGYTVTESTTDIIALDNSKLITKYKLNIIPTKFYERQLSYKLFPPLMNENIFQEFLYCSKKMLF